LFSHGKQYCLDASEVKVKEDYGMSVDIEISSQEGLHSLEGLKELEDCFKDYDIRIW
jgi:hypothetical protein